MNGLTTAKTVGTLLRNRMPVTQKYAYFDHAAVAPLPAPAAQAIADYATVAAHHGDANWLLWAAEVSRLRKSIAELLGAKSEEIALVPNTTYGINLIAEGIPWNAGDNVVIPDNEFPSNFLPWKNLQRRGVELRQVEIPPSGEVSVARLGQAMDAKTRLIALSWVGFSSGFRVDVGQVVEMAHAKGSLVLLDAIQGLGAFPLDVQHSDVDFVCADGHKWMLGPEGAGLLYVKLEHLNWLTPLGLGWNSLETGAFEPGASCIKQSAARYEGGTTAMPGMLGLAASLDVLLGAGANQASSPVAEAILANVFCLEQRLSTLGFQVHLPAQSEHRSGIVGLTWNSAGSSDAAYVAARKHLLAHNVVTSVRAGRLRVSTHAYNNEADIARLADGLVEFCKSHS